MSNGRSPRLLRSVASAPGKLILFGEHAVVHDRPAVAVATSLRTTATLEELRDVDIVLSFPDLCPGTLVVPLLALQPCSSLIPPSAAACPPELLQLLQSIAVDHATQLQTAHAPFMAAVVPALFLLVCIVILPVGNKRCVARGVRLDVHSDLPVGAGLGSSAAFSVSVAAAALELSALSVADACDPPSTPCRIDRSVVNDWALQARATRIHPSPVPLTRCRLSGCCTEIPVESIMPLAHLVAPCAFKRVEASHPQSFPLCRCCWLTPALPVPRKS
jgi:mevalonate kinase